MTRIAFVTRLSPSSEAEWTQHLRQAMPGETIDSFQNLTQAERAEVDIAIVADPDPADLLQLPQLVWVQSLWAGVERLMSELQDFPHPIVRLVDPEMARTMAEAVLAWTYYLFRDMPVYAAQQREQKWMQQPYKTPQKTSVGVLGLGELGAASAARLHGAGFNVLGWSRGQKDLPGISCFAGEDGLKALLSQSEILICLLPLTEQTKGLLNGARLDCLPKSAQIINFARGPIIENAALIAALDKGQIRHAVLDVFEVEPLPVESPFWKHPSVTVLPHISASTDFGTAVAIVAEHVAAYRRDGVIPLAVDVVRGY